VRRKRGEERKGGVVRGKEDERGRGPGSRWGLREGGRKWRREKE